MLPSSFTGILLIEVVPYHLRTLRRTLSLLSQQTYFIQNKEAIQGKTILSTKNPEVILHSTPYLHYIYHGNIWLRNDTFLAGYSFKTQWVVKYTSTRDIDSATGFYKSSLKSPTDQPQLSYEGYHYPNMT